MALAISSRKFRPYVAIALLLALGASFAPHDVSAAGKVPTDPASATIQEGGESQSFDISLTEPIIAATGTPFVTVNISAVDARIVLSTTSVTFAASEWMESRTLTVSAEDDDLENGTSTVYVALSVDANSEFYDNFQTNIPVTVVDDEAGATVDPEIAFVSPTPEDGSRQRDRDIEVKLSTSDGSRHYAFADFDESLAGWWRFEEDSEDDSGRSAGSVWSDDGSGNGEDYASGRYGRAADFDGHSSFDVILDGGIDTDFTVAAWVYLDTQTEAAAIVSDQSGHLLQVGGSGVWQFDNIYDGAVTATTSRWVHLVGVYDQGAETEVLYVDGEEAVSGGGTRTVGDTLNIGKRYDDIYTDGRIDEVMIFRRVLDAGEVASLHDATDDQYDRAFEGLGLGEHTFAGYAVDRVGNEATRGKRTVTVADAAPAGSSGRNRPSHRRTESAPDAEAVVSPNENVAAAPIRALAQDLRFGMTGNDVRVLQEFLVSQGKGPAAAALQAIGATSYFGPLTRAALAEWQLVNGIAPPAGYFGPITRSAIAAMMP